MTSGQETERVYFTTQEPARGRVWRGEMFNGQETCADPDNADPGMGNFYNRGIGATGRTLRDQLRWRKFTISDSFLF